MSRDLPGTSTTRGRRVRAALSLVLALVVAIEGASYALWWLSEGTPFTYREPARLASLAVEEARDAAAREEEAAEESQERIAAVTARAPFHRYEALHPFTGYVMDPTANELPVNPFEPLTVTRDGFLVFPANLEPPTGPPPLRVAVFGGSVAFLFSLDGRKGVARGLAAAGVAPAGGVEIVGRALPGMKQPQQLMALAWLLANGEHYDGVVLLDGFNELTLPAVENVPVGINPYYPRSWHLRVLGLPERPSQERLGELQFLRRRRSDSAASFLGGPWSSTVTGSLVWRSLDRRRAGDIARAEKALGAETSTEGLPFVARGPKRGFRNRQVLFRRLAEFWARSSRQMASIANGEGIAYAHFLQPNQYVAGSKPLTANERRIAFTVDHPYREAVVDGWRHLRSAGEALAAEGVAFHDLTQIFADNREDLYFDDCCHVNERGSELMGEAIGRALAVELQRRDGAAGAATRPTAAGR